MLKKLDFSSLKTILLVALLFRILAAFFSQGYGMHDDHFLIVEASASWVDGFDYNHWLPWSEGNAGHPEGHSFTYVGLNYLFFAAAKLLGIVDPKILMILNRLVHGFISLLVVYFGYKITAQLSTRKNAVQVAWVLALFWVMPFLAVRNLVEVASIPFLMWGFYLLLGDRKISALFWAGFLIGFATSFRYQIGVFALAIAAIYFFQWQWKKLIYFCLGVLACFFLTQGLVDFFIWGYPFAELLSYITYNMKEGTQYMENSNYFMYFYVLFGLFLVPMGIALLIGYFRGAKKYFLLFLPTFVFILFHTLYPNRQERFVLSILPLVFILGFVGFSLLREIKFWDKFWKVSWISFWVLNVPLLLFFTFSSSKLSRVNAMYSLYDNGMQNELILIEATGDTKVTMQPKFYAKSWSASFVDRGDTTLSLNVNDSIRYDYIFFLGEGNLNERIQAYKTLYPKMQLHKKCEPSMTDKLLHTLNPRNTNEYIEVWQTFEKR